MNQYFNFSALKTLFSRRGKRLYTPHFRVPSVNSIDFSALKKSGFKAVVFDKDATLTTPYVNKFHPRAQKGASFCKKVFEDKVFIFSNFAGSKSDFQFKAAEDIEQQLQFRVLRHNCQKPEGMSEILPILSCSPQEVVVIGDRLFTDIAFGNLNGSFTIFVEPVSTENENVMVKLGRMLESVYGNVAGIDPEHEKWTSELKEKLQNFRELNE